MMRSKSHVMITVGPTLEEDGGGEKSTAYLHPCHLLPSQGRLSFLAGRSDRSLRRTPMVS